MNAQYKSLTNAVNKSAIVSITDSKGLIIKVNKLFCEVSGYTEEELIGKTHKLINSGTHTSQFWDEMWKTISAGDTWRAEVCNRAKNGELYWVDTVINLMYDENGVVCQYLSIRSLITDKKHKEVELKQNLAELEQVYKDIAYQKHLKEKIVNSLNEVVWAFSVVDNKYVFISPSVHSICECSVQECEENSHIWKEIVHTDDKDIVVKHEQLLYTNGVAESVYRIVTPSGKIKWVLNKASVLYDNAHKPFLLTGTI